MQLLQHVGKKIALQHTHAYMIHADMSLWIDKMVMVRAPTNVLQVPSAVRLEVIVQLCLGRTTETLCAHMQMQYTSAPTRLASSLEHVSIVSQRIEVCLGFHEGCDDSLTKCRGSVTIRKCLANYVLLSALGAKESFLIIFLELNLERWC